MIGTSLPWALVAVHMGGCQTDGPVLDAYYNTAPNFWGTLKGIIILTPTYMIRLLHSKQGTSLENCP